MIPPSIRLAVLLQVRVGSMSDPNELPGLAHFCEHMLFYSSEKYPVEDEYSRCAVVLISVHSHSSQFTSMFNVHSGLLQSSQWLFDVRWRASTWNSRL
jgi:predicted Zn-dependent peptidase